MIRVSNQFLRAVSLVVTDRRWAAPLSAMALGFGLFIGVAIGPSAAGTLATGAPQIVVVPSSGDDASEVNGGEGGGGETPASGGLGVDGGSGEEAGASETLLPPAAPLTPEASEPAPLPAQESAPTSSPPPAKEEGEVETTELKGTVVHANPAAGSYALAIKGGELVPIHAPKLPPAGAKLTVEGLQLANGTFAEEEKPKRSGKAAQASIRGVITFVRSDPLAPAYTVSGRGASLLVRVPADLTGALPPLPVLGARVTVDVALEPGAVLQQRQIEIEEGEPSTYLDLSGTYAGLSPETGQLLLSADDTRASEADLALTVPPSIKTTKLRIGDSFIATATAEPDGSLKLAGIASDERRKGADDAASAQGDLKR
ncbi:MAG TPA: hypothetical protein VFW48_08305 [Solirubrobacterales bacterium]|nr:hypothetical protein [Solirubrobacterales bacterium]